MIATLLPKSVALPKISKKWLATGALAGSGALVALSFSFAYPANTPPGLAELQAIVTQTTPPNVPGSTSSFKLGDQIQFVGAFKAPAIPVPHWESHITEFGAGQLYVNGSTKTPPGYKASYQIDNTWQTTEPASGALVTKIKYTYEPASITITPAPPAGFVTTGSGDGYRTISFEGKIYMVNHHAGNPTTAGLPGKPMKCYASVGATTNECPGWEGGRELPIGTYTSGSSTEGINRNTTSAGYGKVYFAAVKGSSAGYSYGFACYDLKKALPCPTDFIAYGQTLSTLIPDYNNYGPIFEIMGLGNVGDKLYALSATGKVVCMNVVTEQKCDTGNGQIFQMPNASFFYTANATAHDNNMPGRNPSNTNYLFMHGNGGVYCFNASADRPCAGNWPVLGLNGQNPTRHRIITNSDGSFKSLCILTYNVDNNRCVDINGNTLTVGLPTNVSLLTQLPYRQDYSLNFTTIPTEAKPTPKRRIYYTTVDEDILCYDEDDGAPCAGFSMTRTNVNNGKRVYMYTIVPDPERPNCFWTNADSGLTHSFDAFTGNACTYVGGKVTKTTKPIDAYNCDPASANITGWDAIVTSGEPTANLRVKIFNAVTNIQIGDELSFPAGQTHIDISSISYTTYPHLKIEIQNNSTTPINNLVADVTWKGSPKQFCSKVTAGDDCEASAKFTASSTDIPTSSYTSLLPLNKLLIKDQARQGFGAGSAVSNTEIKNKPLIFRGTFDEVTLSGDMTVARYEYDPTATTPTLGPGNVIISANSPGVTPAPSNRNVITQLPTSATAPNAIAASVGFDWDTIDASQRDLLSKPAPGASSSALDAVFGKKRLDYIRGAAGDEIANGGKLRNRAATARTLGMVLGSSLVYMPTYGNMGYSDAAQPGYAAFARSTGRTKPTVFVNTNNGMLHAYKVDDQGGNNVTLNEQFAYLPNSLIGKMSEYTDKPNFSLVQTPYFNDNTPMVADVKLDTSNNGWATVLASAFGRGAKGLFMLNVTKADTITQNNPQNLAIREFTDANDADMGFIVSQPAVNELNFTSQIVQVKSGTTLRPAVIVGNGINSTNGIAALFIIYLDENGGHVKITMPATAIAGVANGLSTPRVLSSKVAGVADRVYAGDLHGNMWAIDISDLSKVITPYNLFNTGLDATGKPIPITTAPTAMPYNPSNVACANCWMVNFATGKPTTGVLLYDRDIQPQTTYGIWDKGTNATVVKSKLVEQSIDVTTAQGSTVKNRPVDYTSPNVLGWFMGLPAGQMAVANPLLRPNGTYVMFTIKQAFASSGICTAGDGDVYEIIAYSGNTNTQTIDTNGDLKIDSNDLITVTGPTSTTQVAPATKSVGEAQRGATQIVQLTTGSGLESKVLSSGKHVLEGSAFGSGPKRIAWREIVN